MITDIIANIYFLSFLSVPSIKTEPLDEFNPSLAARSGHSGLGSVPQNYYPQHPLNNSSPSCLVANLVSCQQVRGGVPSPDPRYPQQSPPSAAAYQRSKSLSPSQLGFHQSPLSQIAMPDAHRSVLVHAGSPVHIAANPQPSPVIHFSPTNHQMRCGSHQEFQHIMCSDFSPALPRPSQPQRISPSSYPTVIQQQSSSQRSPKSMTPGPEKEDLPTGVTVKQEQNLDQAYLDDGKTLYTNRKQ